MANRPSARTDVNRSAILAQLGAQGPASRADLARSLGVSPALMTQLTKDLLADGLIVDPKTMTRDAQHPQRQPLVPLQGARAKAELCWSNDVLTLARGAHSRSEGARGGSKVTRACRR